MFVRELSLLSCWNDPRAKDQICAHRLALRQSYAVSYDWMPVVAHAAAPDQLHEESSPSLMACGRHV